MGSYEDIWRSVILRSDFHLAKSKYFQLERNTLKFEVTIYYICEILLIVFEKLRIKNYVLIA